MSERPPRDPGGIAGQVAAFRELLARTSAEDLAAALGAARGATGPSRRRPRRDEAVTYLVRVVLDEVEPPVWRLIKVPSSTRLDVLHGVVQAAMGWAGGHLHGFSSGDEPADPAAERYLTELDVEEGDEGVAEADVTLDEVLAEPADRLFYAYDFGDGWHHTLTLEVVEPCDDDPPVRCLDGARACPPEDCGGPDGYAELLEIARAAAAGRPIDGDGAERLRWVFPGHTPGDIVAKADQFDRAQADDAVAYAAGTRRPGGAGRSGAGRSGAGQARGRGAGGGRAGVGSRRTGKVPAQPEPGTLPEPVGRLLARAGPGLGLLAELVAAAGLDQPVLVDASVATRMVEPFAWLVRYVGTRGVDLTSAGYLRPPDVAAVAEHLRLGGEWLGSATREVHAPPVLEFRQACQAVGLLRPVKGRVTVTRNGVALAEDPVALWWYLAGRLPLGRRDVEQDAGAALLLVAAAGRDEEPLPAVLAALGWAPRAGGTLEPWQVRRAAASTWEVLRRLGAVSSDTPGKHGPTSEGVAFSRAALRAWA